MGGLAAAARGQSAAEQRRRFTARALQQPPRSPPGTDSYYCSDGYIVAGSLLERMAHMEGETLVRTRLFQPLGLASAHYGVTSDDGAAAVVSGHEDGWFGRTRVIAPDAAEYGMPPFGAPAGFLSCSVPDLLRYVDFHLQGDMGNARLLSPASFQHLHAPLGTDRYALGWEIEVTRDDHGRVLERSLYHGGYSGRFRANLWFVPETQWGTVIVMNHGRGDDSITSDIFYALLRAFQLLPPAGVARQP